MCSEGPTEAQIKIVHDILAAKTLYDVLGVTSATCSNGSQLRKAYLTTSVKVHPDKNGHPEATAAFQRVAEAYATLNDDSSRAQYDAELRGTKSGGFSSAFGGRQSQSQHHQQQEGTQYAYDFERSHMPSFAEALFMFATATSMLSSAVGGGAGAATGATGATRASSTASAASDFMETIFWATQLAEGRQQQQQQHDQRSFDPNDPTQQEQPSATETAKNNPMASGMALGSGLRAIAATQRMMGMKKSAAATEKAATTVQVAAMGATVLKAAQGNPAVQRTLERGQNTLRENPQIGKRLLSSLKMAGSVIAALQEAQQESQQQQQQQQQQSSNGTSGGNRNSTR